MWSEMYIYAVKGTLKVQCKNYQEFYRQNTHFVEEVDDADNLLPAVYVKCRYVVT
jgi:hypothetical protein